MTLVEIPVSILASTIDHNHEMLNYRPALAGYGDLINFLYSDEQHEWFMEINPRYAEEVFLRAKGSPFDSSTIAYWYLSFKSKDLALMYKLRWGGR